MRQETRAYPATQSADTEGSLPEHLPADPCPSHHVVVDTRHVIIKLHSTRQLKSDIQSATYTLNCEAKWKALRKLEFQTLVSESVILPCVTTPPMI